MLTDEERRIVEEGSQPIQMHNGAMPPVLTRLSALDDLFAATGTVEVKVTRGGKETFVTLPIQSVDNEMVETLARPFRPKLPTKRDMINGQWRTILDEASQEYQDKLGDYNRLNSYIWAFCALAVDVVDEHGTVMWSADNSVHDVAGARATLKRMGFVDNQLITVMRAARNLTAIEDGEQAGE